MAIDLLECEVVGEMADTFGYRTTPACYLASMLCLEAGVCLETDDYPHDAETNPVLMTAATYARDEGLRVTDADGRVFRLRVTAEEVTKGTPG